MIASKKELAENVISSGGEKWITELGNEELMQPTAAEIKRKSLETKQKERAKGKVLEPVNVQGRDIVKKWWGKAWCENLERYADYDSRLDRGRRYIRTGAVLDLKIQKGKILARVQGSRKAPYKVEIRISPLSEKNAVNYSKMQPAD